MTLDIDGFAILKAIAGHPSTFSDVESEARKTARALIIKQVKHKTTDLKKAREIFNLLGSSAFRLVVDGFPDAQIKTLVARLDKSHPDLKTETSPWRRQHLIALLDGSREPIPRAAAKKPPSVKKTAKKKSEIQPAAEPEVLSYRSAGAQRER
jgi:hypothetical protein